MYCFFFDGYGDHRDLHVLTHSFPTRRSSDLLRAWSAACGMSSGTACSGVGHGNAPQGAGLTSARGDRNRGPCSPRPAGYDAGNWVGRAAMGDGFAALYIFMLAAIAGNVIISRVPVILHTPLMSGSNFIHGIVLIGAMVVLGHADTTLEKVIGFAAVLLGAGNAAGGYVVTERMLDMFKSSRKPGDKA